MRQSSATVLSGPSILTVESAPSPSTLPQCFVGGTYFQRSPTRDLVLVEDVRIGDRLCGPDGSVLVQSNNRKDEREYDLVDFSTDAGIISLTADHRVVILEGSSPRTCAAAEAPAEGSLFMDSGCATKYRSSKRIATVAVFDVKFAEDKLVYILHGTRIAAAKGGPGESWFHYGSALGMEGQSSLAPKSKSAPPTVFESSARSSGSSELQQPDPLLAVEACSEVQLKGRRRSDPTVVSLLSGFAREMGCQHLLEGLRPVPTESKSVARLPTRLAVELEARTQDAYHRWRQYQSIVPGRSSRLVWKHALGHS
mmetsp:Transcript_76831/g.199650  ORF Transcript_76831/g.199650 Transcript_76831/m.199650 type:complete len:311 (-) Transcript_76831:226-1158(-)